MVSAICAEYILIIINGNILHFKYYSYLVFDTALNSYGNGTACTE